jgi:hypothetical protein
LINGARSVAGTMIIAVSFRTVRGRRGPKLGPIHLA